MKILIFLLYPARYFSTAGIKCIFEKLEPSKSIGSDGVLISALKLYATKISPILQVFLLNHKVKEHYLMIELEANIIRKVFRDSFSILVKRGQNEI